MMMQKVFLNAYWITEPPYIDFNLPPQNARKLRRLRDPMAVV